MKTITTLFFLCVTVFSQAQIKQAYLLNHPEVNRKLIVKQQIKQLAINEYDKTTYEDRPMIQEIYHFDNKGRVIQAEFYGGETYTDTYYEWMNDQIVKITYTIYGETQTIIPVYNATKKEITINNQPKTDRLDAVTEVVTLNKKGKITFIQKKIEGEKEATISTFKYKKKRQLIAKITTYPTDEQKKTTYEYKKKKLIKAMLPYVEYSYQYQEDGKVIKRMDSSVKEDKLYYTEYIYE